jgi:hypothetical protein
MLDLIGLADLLAVRDCHIIFDKRIHPSESLMHPGLTGCQGAALLVYYDDVFLSSEEVIRLLSKSELIPVLQPQAGDKKNPSGADDPKAKYPTSGTRLLSTFSITDCLQILSGTNYYVFDPSGDYLFSGDADSSENGGGGAVAAINTHRMSRAQKCDIASRDILSRFPDQFRAMLSLNLKPSSRGQGVGGTIIRMPLRSVRSTVSARTCSVEEAGEVMTTLCGILEPSLVFSQHVRQYNLITYTSSAIPCQTISLTVPTADYRSARFKLLKEKGWKSSGITSIFSQFSPMENSMKVAIRVKETSVDDSGESKSSEKDSFWLLNTILGAPAIRELAARSPYRPLKLYPIVTLATNISKELVTISPDNNPNPGFVFCGNQPVCMLGIPYFIEGPFVQDLSTRDIDLTLTDSRRNSTFAFMESTTAVALTSQVTAMSIFLFLFLFPSVYNKHILYENSN